MTMPFDKKTIFTMLLIILFYVLAAYGIWLLYSYQLQRLEHHSYLLLPSHHLNTALYRHPH
jgi:hypothetical protein